MRRALLPLLLMLGGLAAFALSPRLAGAVPADAHLTVQPGEERFFKPIFKVEGAFVEPPEAASVESLEGSGDLFVEVSPSYRGVARVFAYSAYRVWVYSLCVAEEGEAPQDCPSPPPSGPRPLLSECPAFGPGKEDGEQVWLGAVIDEPCLLALRRFLAQTQIPAGSLRLTMEEAASRSHFLGIGQATLARAEFKDIKISFLGPTYVFSGKTTRPVFESLLSFLWQQSLGSVSFEAEKLTIAEGRSPASSQSRRLGEEPSTKDPSNESAPRPRR